MLVASWFDCARELEETVAEGRFSMINVRYYTEVSETFNWNSLNTTLEVGDWFCMACYLACESSSRRDGFEELGGIVAAEGAREPEEGEGTSLHRDVSVGNVEMLCCLDFSFPKIIIRGVARFTAL